jgi:hypothetical protein
MAFPIEIQVVSVLYTQQNLRIVKYQKGVLNKLIFQRFQ